MVLMAGIAFLFCLLSITIADKGGQKLGAESQV